MTAKDLMRAIGNLIGAAIALTLGGVIIVLAIGIMARAMAWAWGGC